MAILRSSCSTQLLAQQECGTILRGLKDQREADEIFIPGISLSFNFSMVRQISPSDPMNVLVSMPFLSSKARLLLTLGLLIRLVTSELSLNSTCYSPDGTTLTTDVPCSTNGTAAACCADNAYCLSNGLCLSNLHLVRATCTDPTWKHLNVQLYVKIVCLSLPFALLSEYSD